MARKDRDYDDDDDDLRRKIRKKSNNNVVLFAVLGAGGFMLLLCCGGVFVGGWLVFRRVPAEVNKAIAAANKDRKRMVRKDDFKAFARGPVVFTVNGNLTQADPPDPTPDLAEVNARMKIHNVNLQQGKTYIITMDSDDFDAYLRVESAAGALLAEDDDSGGDLNAKIVFRPAATGMHRVIATAWDGGFGRYRLKVQEAD